MASAKRIHILAFGDVVGQPGRKALAALLPKLRTEHKVDFVFANVENLAHGKGITQKTFAELTRAGVEYGTSGNHIVCKDGLSLLADPAFPVIRPANFPDGSPGRGMATIQISGKKLLLINLIGTTFFRDGASYKNPFQVADELLETAEAKAADMIIVDFHAEATSEKVALGWYLDGRVSAVLGTHTHVATADLRILPNGTAFVSDLGMTGLRDEVLGVEKGIIINNFLHPDNTKAHVWTDEGPIRVSGVLLTIDPSTHRAVETIRIDREFDQ